MLLKRHAVSNCVYGCVGNSAPCQGKLPLKSQTGSPNAETQPSQPAGFH